MVNRSISQIRIFSIQGLIMNIAKVLLVGFAAACLIGCGDAADKKLQIGVKKRISPEDCKMKSRKGDKLEMHYTVCNISV